MNKGRLLTFSTIAGGILLVGITLLAVVALNKEADENRRVATQMAEIETKAYQIGAVEDKAIAERQATSEAVQNLAEIRSQMLEDVSRLQARFPETTVLNRFYLTYAEYAVALDEEIRLLQSGDLERARELHESRAHPSFDEMMGALGQAQRAFEQIAHQVMHRGQIWMLVVVLGSAAAFLGLFWQYERARRRTQLAVVKQEALRQSEEKFRALFEQAGGHYGNARLSLSPAPTR